MFEAGNLVTGVFPAWSVWLNRMNLVYHEKTKPLIRVEVNGKQQVVAWSFNHSSSKDGRSFGTTMCRFHGNFALPSHY